MLQGNQHRKSDEESTAKICRKNSVLKAREGGGGKNEAKAYTLSYTTWDCVNHVLNKTFQNQVNCSMLA